MSLSHSLDHQQLSVFNKKEGTKIHICYLTFIQKLYSKIHTLLQSDKAKVHELYLFLIEAFPLEC